MGTSSQWPFTVEDRRGQCKKRLFQATIVGFGTGSKALVSRRPHELPPISERARKVHAAGMLFDGHNDLPWRLRTEGESRSEKFDLSKTARLGPDRYSPAARRGREGPVLVGLHPQRARQPRAYGHRADRPRAADGRAISRRLEMAYSADDVERIVKAGKIASLIGIEGGVAIENGLAQLRAFSRWAPVT